MNNTWNMAKFGLMLLALPMVATAAASAHLQLVQSSPITVGTEVYASNAVTVRLDRVHTVALNRHGGVDGRIVAFQADSTVTGLSDLNVRFVKKGETVSQGKTDADGVFSAQNLPEGIYSFIASGEKGFAAYSVRVVSDNTGTYDDSMEAVAVSQVDSVKKIIVDKPASQSTESAIDKALMDVKGANRVVLKNGTLSGRVLLTTTDTIETTEVHILKDGISVEKVMTDENGEYNVPDMKPGVYAFVAVGPQGMAVVAFEAVEFDNQVNNSVGTTTFVSTAAQDVGAAPVGQEIPVYTDSLNVYLTGTQDGEISVGDNAGIVPFESAAAGESIVYGGAGGSFDAVPTYSAPVGGAGGRVGGRGARWAAIIGVAVAVPLAVSGGDDGDGGIIVDPPIESNVDPIINL
jgi:hypothetical protein